MITFVKVLLGPTSERDVEVEVAVRVRPGVTPDSDDVAEAVREAIAAWLDEDSEHGS